ncbi:MAG TPA: DUF1579 family protein [Methylomirabilota bacterium]|nr:DUF1579 family protein [Methylomirabilota bacterium]
MRKQVILAVVAVFLCGLLGTSLARSQQGPPKPGPEHEKLAYFAGTWLSEGEAKASPYGPAGRFAFRETCEWFEGRFALLCRSEGKFGDIPIKGISVMSYDPTEKKYIYFESNSLGENELSHGTVNGDTWTWNGQSKGPDGKPIHGRFTLKQVSADVATYRFEMGPSGDSLALVMEGKQTRQK